MVHAEFCTALATWCQAPVGRAACAATVYSPEPLPVVLMATGAKPTDGTGPAGP